MTVLLAAMPGHHPPVVAGAARLSLDTQNARAAGTSSGMTKGGNQRSLQASHAPVGGPR